MSLYLSIVLSEILQNISTEISQAIITQINSSQQLMAHNWRTFSLSNQLVFFNLKCTSTYLPQSIFAVLLHCLLVHYVLNVYCSWMFSPPLSKQFLLINLQNSIMQPFLHLIMMTTGTQTQGLLTPLLQ